MLSVGKLWLILDCDDLFCYCYELHNRRIYVLITISIILLDKTHN